MKASERSAKVAVSEVAPPPTQRMRQIEQEMHASKAQCDGLLRRVAQLEQRLTALEQRGGGS